MNKLIWDNFINNIPLWYSSVSFILEIEAKNYKVKVNKKILVAPVKFAYRTTEGTKRLHTLKFSSWMGFP